MKKDHFKYKTYIKYKTVLNWNDFLAGPTTIIFIHYSKNSTVFKVTYSLTSAFNESSIWFIAQSLFDSKTT